MSTTTKKRFGVYHPLNGALNTACDVEKLDYEYITSIESENLVRVFYKAQNDFNPEYATLGKRSTSVGDIVVDNDRMFMYMGVGFKRIPKTKALYEKIMTLDEAIIEILSRRTLTDDDVNKLMDNCY